MQRRQFIHRGSGLLLAAQPFLAWADNDKSKKRRKERDSENVAGIAASNPNPQASGPAKSRVIVVGGGMAGATVAKYLRLWGDAVEVLLIERRTSYTSNIMSAPSF